MLMAFRSDAQPNKLPQICCTQALPASESSRPAPCAAPENCKYIVISIVEPSRHTHMVLAHIINIICVVTYHLPQKFVIMHTPSRSRLTSQLATPVPDTVGVESDHRCSARLRLIQLPQYHTSNRQQHLCMHASHMNLMHMRPEETVSLNVYRAPWVHAPWAHTAMAQG